MLRSWTPVSLLCFHLAATVKENVYSASQSISARPHGPFTVRPLQRFLILACYMLYLLLSNFPSSSALSSICPLLPLPLPSQLPHPFISPSALSLPFSFPLCTLERLALIKLIAMVIHLNGFLSCQRLPAAAAETTLLQRDGRFQSPT